MRSLKPNDFQLVFTRPHSFKNSVSAHTFKLLLAITLSCCLAGCGWQIRGAQDSLGASLKETGLSIEFKQRNPSLTQVAHNLARSNQIPLSSDAPTTLIVEREMVEKKDLALTETGVTAQYQLILTIYFHIKDNETTLVAPTQISSWRSYDFDAKQIAAKAQEEQALLKEMREELVTRMLIAAGGSR